MQKAPSHPISRRTRRLVLALSAAVLAVMTGFTLQRHWQSRFVRQDGNGMLTYLPDKQGDIFPDFSRVGYYQGNRPIPRVATAVFLSPSGIKGQDDRQRIQQAIDSLSALPVRQDGFRGALLLKKGTYRVSGTLHVDSSGIVLRGEGDGEKGTVIVATGTGQRTLIDIRGQGAPREVPASRSRITEPFVPVGVFGVTVENPALYHAGDRVILLRPGTQRWIHDLKMDQIVPKKNTVQWTPAQYNLRFKRRVTRVSGDTVFMDNPVVMQLSDIYGGGYLYRYTFPGCIRNVGVESIRFQSEYAGETDENHGWTAVSMNTVTDAWVRGVTAQYFGYSCVLLGTEASQVTVTDSRCLDAKSRITGGRRYSFCNNGQLNLFTRLFTREGRHDFVTGARTLGPNVFYDCVAERTHADIGPHHRWSVGTLYDRVRTDGRMSVQDRGNSGTGHGWTGVTQIFWNCKAREAVVQNPWVSGENYCIGLEGNKWAGHFPDRPQGVWEGENTPGLLPASLFLAERSARSGQSAE